MNIKNKIIKKLSNLDIKNDLFKIRKILNIINPINKETSFLEYKLNLVNRDLNFRIFNKNSEIAIIYIHGGGWSTGNIDTYTTECNNLSNKTNTTVISLSYRLAPENKFPKGLEDCYELTKMIVKNKKYKEIILMGDSAGGNLAVCVAIKALQTKEFKINKQILLYPSLQSNYSNNTKYKSIEKNGKDYLLTQNNLIDYMNFYVNDENDLLDPLVSPLYYKKLNKMPKTLILVGDKDPLVDENIEYSKKLKDCKIKIYKDTMHGFLSNPFGLSIRNEMYKDINEFIGEKNENSK